jgi:hypothetical protein
MRHTGVAHHQALGGADQTREGEWVAAPVP